LRLEIFWITPKEIPISALPQHAVALQVPGSRFNLCSRVTQNLALLFSFPEGH